MINFIDVPKLVINLEHRKDMRENISEVLKDYDYEIVEAIKTKLGCNLSHQKCIKLAIERDYEMVCIMEDDFIFIKDEEIIIPNKFDMFFIGGQIIDVYKDKINSYKITKVRRAECYIINKHYYHIFLNMLEECWELLNKDPNNINYRFDMYWQTLVDNDNWRVNKIGNYGGQREGYSDIKNEFIKRTNKNYII